MIKAIGTLPKQTTKAINKVTQETKNKFGQVNSYEFQLGFIPTHKKGAPGPDPEKVARFIDQIV